MDTIRLRSNVSMDIPNSVHCTHPDSLFGQCYEFGGGAKHTDIVNYTLGGYENDVAYIYHVLSAAESRKISIGELKWLLATLEMLQNKCKNQSDTTLGELDARQDSIDVVKMVLAERLPDNRQTSSSSTTERAGPTAATATAAPSTTALTATQSGTTEMPYAASRPAAAPKSSMRERIGVTGNPASEDSEQINSD